MSCFNFSGRGESHRPRVIETITTKEDKTMTNFKIGNIEYIENENGYCYKVEDGKKTRIGKAAFEEARAKAEKAPAKKKAKRAKKNVAFAATIALADDKIADVTLTANQVAFLNKLPDDGFFQDGAESTIWTDVYCDTIADVMNAMVAGAIISTLREKDLIYVAVDNSRGRKSKYFGFTDLGKAILKELGLV